MLWQVGKSAKPEARSDGGGLHSEQPQQGGQWRGKALR